MPQAPATTCNATLIHRQDLTSGLSIVRIQSDAGDAPAFIPGQFCTLGLPAPSQGAAATTDRVKFIRRAYSIASAADERRYLELLISLVEDGKMTPQLWDVPTGGRVFLDPRVRGHFTLDAIAADQDLIMVATGTGLAPFISMIRTYRQTKAQAGAARRSPPHWRRLVLIHSARYANELAYSAEMQEACREDGSVIYIPTVTREPADSPWHGQRGRLGRLLDPDVYQDLTGGALDPGQCRVLLCGSPHMITDVQKQLEGYGFLTDTRERPGQIYFERYW